MAARKNRGTKDNPWSQKTRERIKTAQLINRMQSFVLGQKDPQGNEVNMSTAQVAAAKALLDRTMPTLSMSDVNNHGDGDVSLEELKMALKSAIEEMADDTAQANVVLSILGMEELIH